MACFIGNAIGDSLGANTEFNPINYKNKIFLNSFNDLKRTSRC